MTKFNYLLIPLIAVSLGLAACNPPNPITMKTIYEAEAAYDGAFLVPVAHYRALPLCPPGVTISTKNVCADRTVLVELQAADNAVHVAVLALRTFVKNNPTLDASAYIAALTAAVQVAEQLVVTNGLK